LPRSAQYYEGFQAVYSDVMFLPKPGFVTDLTTSAIFDIAMKLSGCGSIAHF
jgi:hypothetical protein